MRKKSAIQRQIQLEWPAIEKRAGTRPATLPQRASIRVLGTGTKTELGVPAGVHTAVAYMSPADEAFPEGDTRTLCAFATAACAGACLGKHAGRMIFDAIANARLWKSTLYIGARGLWRELVAAEVAAHERQAARKGLIPAVRIDGSTDTGEGARLAPLFPGTRFYDYTKSVRRALKHATGNYAANYHVTFSYSGENGADCRAVLDAGGSVAVVFDADPRSKGPIPLAFEGAPVFDGDSTDIRFFDPAGPLVVGLRFKQSRARATALAAAVAGGFVVATRPRIGTTNAPGDPVIAAARMRTAA